MENLAIVLIPLFVMGLAQLTKFIIFTFKSGGIRWNYIMTHGHMPSTHSALATSLVTTIGYSEGIGSGEFMIAVVLALIILDDAVRIRMYLGDQGRFLNMLTQTLNLDPKKYPRLKEHVGHRISEVVCGVLFGFIFSWLCIQLFV
ncbi:divergent PAP2 family protein [bacterium]|jgi:uncharacterized protein|nr:divergent PAP2 family protein [bacterium]MBT4251386.1 divergent PAP2 family protein [bacterium]MBT4598122.1 divergent PAP2 family protein [bacterium]MBT6754337.1 divergent PAP2 family protein [bacterium]MBT7037260.1 divergent PAP2 family protein [bacterium]